MRLNTLVTLGASAAFGLMAVLLARGWINEAIEDEFRDNRPKADFIMKNADATLPIVIAANDLSFGDELTAEVLRIVNYPKDAVPVGSYSSLDEIFTDTSKRTVVLSQMRLNEPLMNYKISGPGGKGSLSARISDGYRAAAIRVDDVTGVAGFIVPGDFVDVIYTRDPETRRNGTELISDILLQNIKVLGIDQNQNENSSAADIARTVTVEVSNDDAQRLHLALDTGKLSLTLRAAGEQTLAPVQTVKSSQLGKMSAIAKKAPIRRAAVTAQKSESSNIAQVTIIRGDIRDEVTVLRESDAPSLAGG